MAGDETPLSAQERAELEELRAQKAAREQAEQARRERAELEELRRQSAREAQVAQESEEARAREQRSREARERGRQLMEPGDDLSMPLGQRLVLVALALIVIGIIVAFVWGRG